MGNNIKLWFFLLDGYCIIRNLVFMVFRILVWLDLFLLVLVCVWCLDRVFLVFWFVFCFLGIGLCFLCGIFFLELFYDVGGDEFFGFCY